MFSEGWEKLNTSRKVLLIISLIILAGLAWSPTNSNQPAQPQPLQQEITKEVLQEEPKAVEVVKPDLYQVVSVTDGDTIRVMYNGVSTPVRFIGIDAPEINSQDCYAQEAKDYLETLLLNKKIKLEIDEKSGDTDKYNRLLRYVFLEDGVNVNLLLIKEGYAKEYTYDANYKYQEEFKSAHEEAYVTEKGMWSAMCDDTVLGISTSEPVVVSPTPVQPVQPTQPVKSSSPSYTCSCSKTCKQMSSCEEAYYQLNTCGCSARDGDDDGVPCEEIC